jgi:hypothetical protein
MRTATEGECCERIAMDGRHHGPRLYFLEVSHKVSGQLATRCPPSASSFNSLEFEGRIDAPQSPLGAKGLP